MKVLLLLLFLLLPVFFNPGYTDKHASLV